MSSSSSSGQYSRTVTIARAPAAIIRFREILILNTSIINIAIYANKYVHRVSTITYATAVFTLYYINIPTKNYI